MRPALFPSKYQYFLYIHSNTGVDWLTCRLQPKPLTSRFRIAAQRNETLQGTGRRTKAAKEEVAAAAAACAGRVTKQRILKISRINNL
jgi:hypothetical protein